tara:strand:- start:1973 stop:2935 length:963 start_codon:yes stop_codon:yes gene_type:complete
MATLTVAGVEEALSKYKTVGSSFIQELNLVLPRLYAMGMWRDLLYETVISTTDGNFTLPEGESIVSAMIENDPAKVRSQFHDYRLTGRNNDGVTLAMYGLVDDGFVPTINELDSSKTYKIEVAPIYPETELPRTTNDFITVTGLNNSTTPVAITYEPKIATATSSSVTSTSLFTSIEEIRNGDSSLSAPVRVTAVNNADATDRLHLADVQESNKVSRFRRYRLNNNVSLTVTKTMRLLVKRKFKTLINSYDPVYPSNLNAIKHGLLGTVAEDNADIERANYHWAICKQLLDEELDAYRGAAKPTIIFDPSGSNSRVPNIL